MAADISPIDVISHIPVLCEDAAIPYVFVGAKSALGESAGTKRPTSVVLVASKPAKGSVSFDAQDKLNECLEEIKDLTKKA